MSKFDNPGRAVECMLAELDWLWSDIINNKYQRVRRNCISDKYGGTDFQFFDYKYLEDCSDALKEYRIQRNFADKIVDSLYKEGLISTCPFEERKARICRDSGGKHYLAIRPEYTIE